MMQTLIWYIENIVKQAFQMLPCMMVALLVWSVVRPLRLRQVTRRGLYSPRRRELMLMLYVLFCAGLGALTLFPYGFWGDCMRMLWEPGFVPKLDLPGWENGLRTLRGLPRSMTPFREILRVNHGGPWLWFVFWGNIGMFAPIGFGLGLLWRRRRWYHALLLGLLCSVGIELTQIFVGRVSDIDDIMLNTVGAMAGFVLYCIISKVIPLNLDGFHCQMKEEA